ncbi:chorismate mutase [Lacisediminihabitans sp.]|uniref:chorismate mutase n=1 Tax=Lacisediminihabitans sp. TaxID=2787631 RepID=UPI00374CF02C
MADELDPSAQLLSLRQSIDNVDAALVHLLAERFKFTQQVGRLKATSGLPPADPNREREQIQKLKALAVESHLDPAFGEKFLNFIIAEVIHQHEQIANTGSVTTLSE